MEHNTVQFLVSQLAYRIPTLLACALGFVLALIYFRKCRLPALLTILAVCLMAAASLGTAFAQTLLMQAHANRAGNQDVAQYAQMMGIVGVLGAVVDAGSVGLLLIAVFVGRRGNEP